MLKTGKHTTIALSLEKKEFLEKLRSRTDKGINNYDDVIDFLINNSKNKITKLVNDKI